MQMLFRGLQVPALGSPRDIIYRKYLTHETQVEIRKSELQVLIALSNPSFSEDSSRIAWGARVSEIFDKYIHSALGVPYVEKEQKPSHTWDSKKDELINFYTTVVKPSKPIITKERGQLTVKNLPAEIFRLK